MEARRVALQGNPLGIQPEQVLVLETVGSVDSFINVIRRVNGLEWLGESELIDIPPDDDFQDIKDPQKLLTGQLFLVMSDQRALAQLQGLFNKWRANPDSKFPHGLAPLKRMFEQLRTIRNWGIEDRIRETGIFESWRRDLQENPDRQVSFLAELWFRDTRRERELAELSIHSIIVRALGGIVVQQCVIPEIRYHALLGRIPASQASAITSRLDLRLLQIEDIMYLRPVGQYVAPAMRDDSAGMDVLLGEEQKLDAPVQHPVIALLDGLPLSRHRLLDDRLIVDDPDGYEAAYQARERVHGTAMASLICHGELDDQGSALSRLVYVRPILQPRRRFDGQFEERIPDSELPVDLVHRSVRRLFEDEDDNPPAAPSVRVISLSVCDPGQPFYRELSCYAQLLDWLADKYNVLFIVSAGNHLQDIELDVPRQELQWITPQELQETVSRAIVADARNRRLLSPAETLNGLTVGATHADASTLTTNANLIDPYQKSAHDFWSLSEAPGNASEDFPSTISAQGPGYRRSVKPEIYFPGGRQFLSERLGNSHANAILEWRGYTCPPGQCVATPGPEGQLDRTLYSRGTSNAAALASRSASLLYDAIERLRAQPGPSLPRQYDALLIKALLVHGAHWSEKKSRYESILRHGQVNKVSREYVGRLLGYGSASIDKVMSCTDQRVTVLGFGELGDGGADEYDLPLPPSLSMKGQWRRLTITLAWFTPINTRHRNYRIAHLWFDPANSIAPNRMNADGLAAQRGTLQHEVLEGNKVVNFQDGETIKIKVNCRADAGEINEPIKYSLAVTLEIAEGIEIPIYQQVRERLAIRIPVGTNDSR